MALSRKELARRRALGEQRAKVRFLIKQALDDKGFSGVSLAEKLGCSGQNVSSTILGRGHSELVLNGLREIGVPEDLLFDPRRVEVWNL